MASSRPSASSRDLLVGLQSTAGLRATKSRLARASLPPSSQPSATARPPPRPPPSDAPPRRRLASVSVSLSGLAACSSAVSPPPALNTAPLSPLDDASVASDVSGVSILNRLKELHCGPLFGSSDEEADEGGSYGPHAALSGLFDDDSDEETRSVDSDDWHPYALPSAPAKHPANGRVNHYDPAAPWDYSLPVNIEQLHDVRGESPHLCFLVEWQITPLQLSWVWEEQLRQRFARRMDQGCFMDALRAALYHLGDTGLASTSTELWVDFVRDHPNTSPLDASYTNVERFQTFVQTLFEGVYLTSIGDGLVGHCVVVLAKGPDTDFSVLDGVELRCPRTLTNLAYLDKVKWMGLMKLNQGIVAVAGNESPGQIKESSREKKKQKL
ncbi:hypothetical protein PInf_006241 [Phytophthora infestans]|nr:hypothetical protein PInf_006241 [Phytophthora infestans]